MRTLNQIKRKNLVKTSVQTLARKRRTPILFFILPLPGLIALLMFSYLPMVGLYIVFERYTYQGGLFGSEFVGLKNFEFFFRNMSNALRATRNTLVINCFSILFGIAVNVALAIAVNEIRSVRFRKVTQSIMLFPHFISWVVVGMVFNVLLSEGSGVVNRLLVQLGMDPVKWYTNPWYWWPILVFANVWKSMGYGSLVYFAALTGFDQNLYEAAEIDGASRWQKIAKITLPLLKPTIIIMFLLQVGGILGGAVDPIMGMTQLNPSLLETTDTIATFVYRSAMVNGNFASGSAITLYQSIFGFLFVTFCNWIVKKVDPEYVLF